MPMMFAAAAGLCGSRKRCKDANRRQGKCERMCFHILLKTRIARDYSKNLAPSRFGPSFHFGARAISTPENTGFQN
jgi:hypothetical protein